MADQAERVILEAEDLVTPVVDKANAGLDSLEKKAESSHGKVIRISDQTRSSVQRLIASLEKQAETYGKSGVDRLVAQRDQLLQRYNREPQAIDAITKSYEKMIATQRQIDSEAKFEGFGEKVKQFIENPLQGAKSAVGGLLSVIGPFGGAIAAGAAALGSIAVAGFEAAKSLGEYATRVRDVELRTGLTSKEVGQFGFAARAVGQDVSIVERMMRGLSQAADDTSKDGEKARATMQKLGVTMYDSATGAIKPTAEILEELSGGLARMPNALERDAAAITLFKRAGIEAIPVITELSENLKLAREHGFGSSEEEINRLKEYTREVAGLEMSWERVKRSMLVPVAATVNFLFNGLAWADFLLTMPGKILFSGKWTAKDTEMGETEGWGYGASMSRSGHAAEARSLATNDAMVAAARASDQGNKQLEIAEGKLTQLQGELKTGVFPSVNEPVMKQIDQQRELIAGIKARTEATKELKEWEHQAAEEEKRASESGLDAVGKLIVQRDAVVAQGKKVGASQSELAAVTKAYNDQILDQRVKEHVKDLNRAMEEQNKLVHQHVEELNRDLAEQRKHDEQAERARERIESLDVQAQRETLEREAARAGRMAELTVGQQSPMALSDPEKRVLAAQREEAAAQQAYQIRLDLAVQLAGIEAQRIARETDSNEKAVLAAQARKNLFTELAQAEDQLDEKEAQLQQKRQQEVQSQFDNLEKEAEKVIDVLFTKPKNFGEDLLNTVHAAVLKPVTETLGGMAANALHPIIYGADGQGGLSGLLRGGSRQDPVRVSTDKNTAATMQNSAVMAALTGILAAAMGVAAPSLHGGGAGVLGISIPSISVPATMSMPMAAPGGYSPAPWSSGGAGAPASSGVGGAPLFSSGTGSAATLSVPGFAGLGNLPLTHSAAASMSPVSVLLGTGGTGAGAKGQAPGLSGLFAPDGFSKTLSNLKSSVWNQKAWDADSGGAGGPVVGGIQGVATSKAAGAAGMMLATHGLITDAGTWSGAIQGAAGGALIGDQLGGPIGAAAGASFGFEVGAIEKLIGIKSPAQKAHDDIKSIYNVSIPTNSGTIKQVVQIAQSQFGGDVAVAVRSPSVRQLVMLYSEATGQKIPLSATTPYSGSLVEQGGKLYQQASYQDGQAHVYGSNLPTLGGIAASTYPTPSGPNTSGGTGTTYMSLSISGNDAANFMTGQFVTPQFVTDQAMAAQYSSYGRTQQSANMQLPGLTVA